MTRLGSPPKRLILTLFQDDIILGTRVSLTYGSPKLPRVPRMLENMKVTV